MERAPLLEELLKYKNEYNLILSMPGNKSGKAFLKDDLGRKFKETLGELDITEVDNLDNLHQPEGIIKEAQELLAKTYKVNKAYFLVNGSSSGNLAAIFSAFNEGDEVLVERNCHKSIYNAIILRKLKVVYIESVIDNNLGIFLPPRDEEILKAFNNSKNPKGIILTNPNYFGVYYDLENTIKMLKDKGLRIIIDSAHGAHLGISKSLPKSMAKLGDYVVLSAHKTLPSLTQGAFLLVNNNDENIEFYIKAFMTTSPSYLIMASLDYSRYYLDNYGEEDYDNLIERAELWREKINSLNKVKIIDKIEIDENYKIDKSRYLVTLRDGFSGHKLLDYLKAKKIQAEMSFSKGVVLILSTCNSNNDFEKIYSAFNELDMNLISLIEGNYIYKNILPTKVLEPFQVLSLKCKKISLKESLGKVSKSFIVPYPPGVPVVCPGEIITNEVIEIVEEYLNNNLTVVGIDNKKVEIVDN
ncbi:aminotransferase class I/II-fold pyridoxal phosphate-dependent enzyme [Clostridium sp. AL.422]|uniref:aminotransferase class I/II-fold pyridoxal phosphate-dependent enzyme n=1 Tax=Clostridium TaxID=1485 RepID=UPI00293DF636|nr:MULTISPECIES: aminotransferase class I/II-fold pyridoxal phosphate-dependent enzyme [unclassified Clostridium]MDV4151732.1 aminotransferase class I/II-fold pyridoxal phosphate-dependent enzyme [Clostridium sp. AL.422]